MRILVVGFSYMSDVYQTKLEVLENLEDTHVGLLSPAKWNFSQWKNPFELPQKKKNFQIFPAKVWFFNGRNGAFLYPMGAIIRSIYKFKPDIIYIEQEVFSLSTFQVAFIAKLMNIPVALFCWENMEKNFIGRRFLVKFVLNNSKLITPGNSGAANLLRKWGYKGPIKILPRMGVDMNLFSPPKQRAIRKKFVIGYVGRLVYEKGIDIILHAGKKLLDYNIRIEIVLCGDGPYKLELKKLIDNLKMKSNVRWLGPYKQNEVPKAISEMDILVLPSRTIMGEWMEQFGHVLIEAMAMRVPVIGSDSGAIPEVIGRDDLIFPENNEEKLFDLLKFIIDDKEWRESIAEYCYDRVKMFYTHEIIVKKLRTYLSEILEK